MSDNDFGIPSQYIDTDPEETKEWLESLDALVAEKVQLALVL